MSKELRWQQATRAVWRRGYEACRARPDTWWTVTAPAISELLAELRSLTNEAALHELYWAPGDSPGAILQRHLPPSTDPEQVLELEEACFWLRLRELCAESQK
jgi:hypothetical protein